MRTKLHVKSQPTYPEYIISPQTTFIESATSTGFGCLGNTNFMVLTESDDGIFDVTFKNIGYNTAQSVDYSKISNVQVELRYQDSDMPVSTDLFYPIVFLDADNSLLQIYLYNTSNTLETPDMDTVVLYVEIEYDSVLQSITYPAVGDRAPRSVLMKTIRTPFYVDLSTPATPVCANPNITVTRVSDVYYTVQTKWPFKLSFLTGITRTDDSDVDPTVILTTVPVVNTTGCYFEFKINAAAGGTITSGDFIGVYFNGTIAIDGKVSLDTDV